MDMLYPSRCFLIWDKKARLRTLADCEMAWTSFDKNAKIFTHPRNTGEKRIHICQKPIALYEWIIDNYANKDSKIIDTHLGSGSSAIAAHNRNMEFVGCEINEVYLTETIERITRHIAQQNLF
jgi:site-specific DNA-methyltransferase (adenine-specific)